MPRLAILEVVSVGGNLKEFVARQVYQVAELVTVQWTPRLSNLIAQLFQSTTHSTLFLGVGD